MIGRSGFALAAAVLCTSVFSENVQAFVPSMKTSNSVTTRMPFSASNRVSTEAASSQITRQSSALSMAFFDDILEKTDEKTRQAQNEVYLAELQKRVDRINALEPTIEELGDDELQAKTQEFRERLGKGEDINGPILEEAFAVVREAAWYVIICLMVCQKCCE